VSTTDAGPWFAHIDAATCNIRGQVVAIDGNDVAAAIETLGYEPIPRQPVLNLIDGYQEIPVQPKTT
jgi:hypothetical protein